MPSTLHSFTPTELCTLLNKKYILKSSDIIREFVRDPINNSLTSVDNLSLTVDAPKLTYNQFKELNRSLKKRAPHLKCNLVKLKGGYAKQAKFSRQISIRTSDGYLFSIFYGSTINRGKKRKARNTGKKCEDLFHREVKLSVNPNTFGHDNTKLVAQVLKKLWARDYHHYLSSSLVTELHIAVDLREYWTKHAIVKYRNAYHIPHFTEYSEGFQIGQSKNIIFYNKSLEQGGVYRDQHNYMRIEFKLGTHRGTNRYMTFENAHKEFPISFKGLKFYDPHILLKIPSRYCAMVLFDSLNYMMKILAPKRQDQLEKYMKRHELIFSSQARDDIFSESSSKIIEVQDLFGI